jgi:predicted regulator of Ras-like GTPase activity (Roadblock/LC7/MglB family)
MTTSAATDGTDQPRNQVISTNGELDWLLDDLVGRVSQVEKAVILSRDGLVTAASAGLLREDAEHLSAIAAGFQSLARGAGRHFGGGHARQTIVEMDSAFLFVTAAGEGSCLAVLSSASADVGLVAYEMAVLVKRVGQHLSVHRRPTPVPTDDDVAK